MLEDSIKNWREIFHLIIHLSLCEPLAAYRVDHLKIRLLIVSAKLKEKCARSLPRSFGCPPKRARRIT